MDEHPTGRRRPAGTRGSLVIREDRIPVVFRSWGEWRSHRRTRPQPVAGASPAVARPQFCALCWGNGQILREAGNGEGLVPVTCATCHGRGHTPA